MVERTRQAADWWRGFHYLLNAALKALVLLHRFGGLAVPAHGTPGEDGGDSGERFYIGLDAGLCTGHLRFSLCSLTPHTKRVNGALCTRRFAHVTWSDITIGGHTDPRLHSKTGRTEVRSSRIVINDLHV